MKLYWCLTFLLCAQCAVSLNILAVFPYEGKSHFFVFRVLLRELATRGHNVTVITHFPEKEPLKNYHDISLAGSAAVIEDAMPIQRNYLTLLSVAFFLSSTGLANCEQILANKQVQDLIREKPKFDVVLVEQFNSDCALGLAFLLDAPVVGITSHILMPWQYSRFGIPDNPSYMPFHFLEGGSHPTLYHRIERVLFGAYYNSIYYYLTQAGNQKELAKYYDGIPPLEDLAREIKILLLYHNFILTGSRLFPSNVIEVGGYHVSDAKPVTGDLKKFMEGAEHGIVYISFGSVIKASLMPADKLEAVLNVIKKLPQRFIWKWEDDTIANRIENLYVSKWLPQIDILGHPKTLAFYSHSGMLGTTEAIHFGVPVVSMPILGDQPSNGASVEESGLGVQVQVKDLNEENLLAAFKTVLKPQFRKRVKEISKAWHDRPMSPMDTAIFWIEFVARNPNFNFRTPAADVPFYKHFYLDVLAVFAIIGIALALVLQKLTSWCLRSKGKQDAKKLN